MDSPKNKKTVLLGMSGGVDSSLSAALLLEQGYNVIGCHLTMWSESTPGNVKPLEEDAKALAEQLKIPFITLDVHRAFKSCVVDPFIKEFKLGLTPNPCVFCNKTVKFHALMQKAQELGADYVATGHYAQIKKRGKTWLLMKSPDPVKDQTYFLYTLTQTDLARTLFPIGHLTKKQVRQEALARDLLTKNRPESQGICFIATKNHETFLRRRIRMEGGDIFNKEGVKIGEHEGLALFTLGQRAPVGGPNGPWFVIKLQQEGNALIVTNNPFDPELFSQEIIIDNINWTIGKAPGPRKSLHVKVRHGHEPVPCTVKIGMNDTYRVLCKSPIRAVMPGQSAVLYDKDTVVGGGIITSTVPVNNNV